MKDEAIPTFWVSALCSLQCFDTDDWVAGRQEGIRPVKNPIPLIHRGSLQEQVQDRTSRRIG